MQVAHGPLTSDNCQPSRRATSISQKAGARRQNTERLAPPFRTSGEAIPLAADSDS
jgi:hypothetical protein